MAKKNEVQLLLEASLKLSRQLRDSGLPGFLCVGVTTEQRLIVYMEKLPKKKHKKGDPIVIGGVEIPLTFGGFSVTVQLMGKIRPL